MLTLGNTVLESPLILAPLAGYSDLSFRLLCREYGAGMCVTEMISCHGLVYGQERTLNMLAIRPEERPVSIQIFGADPDIMGEAAEIASSRNPELIDINMGCPVKKVTKRGAGAALMTDRPLAENIIKKVVEKSSCPVTVKFRSGPDQRNINVTEFSCMAEASGIAAVTIHGRTWKQGFSGTADWAVIEKVKQHVSIPVIGNGDIGSYAQGMERLLSTGCDAVMIGRAALGNPWVFSKDGHPTQLAEIIPCVKRHIELLETHAGDHRRILAAVKNHLGKYFKAFPGSSSLRKKLYQVPDWVELKAFLQELDQS